MYTLQKPFIKVIAGIENRNLSKVLDIVDSAIYSGADAVDICDEPVILSAVKQRMGRSNAQIFVSSLDWMRLLEASKLGADMLELGNYDHLYPQGLVFQPSQILQSAKKLIENGIMNLCVTIPGYLSPNEQTELAQNLTAMGVRMIQTEGGSITKAESSGSIGQIEKAKVTLANTLELRRACPNTQILASGGLSNITAPLALAAGADGIGIGKAISNLSTQIEMVAYINSVKEAISNFKQRVSA
jgi:biotin synthase-like enzyme